MIKTKRIFTTPDDGYHYFFGYYDKSPLSADGGKVLVHQVDFMDRDPTAKDFAMVGYFDLNENPDKFIPIAKTYAFNWQQGAMLQWLGKDFSKRVVFNNRINGKFISQVVDIETKEVSVFDFPIYSVSPSGDYALCLDYERLYWCRPGYAYAGIANERKKANSLGSGGIYKLDFNTKNLKLIVDIEEVLKMKSNAMSVDAMHYLEHIQFGPNNKQFSFLHRWVFKNHIYTRLLTSNINGSGLNILLDSGRLTHYCWRKQQSILAWCGNVNALNSMRFRNSYWLKLFDILSPIYKRFLKSFGSLPKAKLANKFSGDGYHLIDLSDKKLKLITSKLLCEDGHPTFSPINENLFVTDTYPDTQGRSKLILFDLNSNTGWILDVLNSVSRYNNTSLRCDLHPKWSYCGGYLSIDTVNDGRRSLYIYFLESKSNEK